MCSWFAYSGSDRYNVVYDKTFDFLWDTDPADLPDMFNTFNDLYVYDIRTVLGMEKYCIKDYD